MGDLLTIGKAAEQAGLPPKTIRYYQEVGLLPDGQRNEAGYRLFSAADIRRLRLVRRAKILGLPLREIKDLASLAFDESCGAFEQRLDELIAARLADVERTISELLDLQQELLGLQETLQSRSSCGACRADECEACHLIDD